MHRFTKPALLLVGIAVSILVPQQIPGAEALSLQDIRWQSLPDTVRTVFLAPNGRLWYRDDSRTHIRSTVADLKRMIAGQFSQPASRIDWIEPVLFEPSGRVWFSLHHAGHSMLAGYDGKTWIDYAIADEMNRVSGVCATDGRLNDGRANRFAGDAAWFIMGGGVLRFDGQHWSYQKMQEMVQFRPGSPSRYYRNRIRLAVAPDGKAAIACASVDEFWIYRDGQWIRRIINARPDFDPRRHTRREPSALVLDGTGTAWYRTEGGDLRPMPIAAQARQEQTPGIATLIDDLRNDSFSTREKAFQELLGRGATIRPQLERALENSDDLEQRTRLKLLLARIASAEMRNENPKDMVFDSVRFARCEALYDDGLGRIFVVAWKSYDDRANLVMIRDPEGHLTKLEGKEFAEGWQIRFYSSHAPILSSDRNRIWLPGKDGEAPKLLDLKAMQVVDAVPHPTYGELHAVSRDGRVFVSAPGSSLNPVLVYSPRAPATENLLKHSYINCSSALFAIGDEGAVWAIDPSGHLVHFNGFQWNSVQGTSHHPIKSLIPGHDDVLLLSSGKLAALYRGTQEIGAGEITELIVRHADLIRKAFGPRPGVRPRVQFVGQYMHALAADRDGNLWLAQPRGRLLVHTQGTWHDTNEALVAAGASEGLAGTLALVGDGSKVLVNELQLRRLAGGSVFFGRVSDGKPHFVNAPLNCRFAEILLNVASPDGSIWMPTNPPFQHGASRADETGVRQEIANAGFPVLVDEAGNLWTVELRSAARDQLNVCRDGKVIQHLQIPQLTDAGFLISDRPGSVYARTTLGLQHLVANGPKFEQYRLGKLYPLEGIGGDRLGQLLRAHTCYGYSKHGYLVVLGSSGTGDTFIQKLFLVKLPTKESPE